MNFFYDYRLGKDLFFGSRLYSKGYRCVVKGGIMQGHSKRLLIRNDDLDRK